MKRKLRKTRDGFTVTELVVLLVILGILAVVVLGILAGNRPRSHQRTPCKANLKQIGLAYAMYCEDYNGHPPSKGNSGDQAYLDAIALLGNYVSNSSKIWHCPNSKDPVLRSGIYSNLTLANVSYTWWPAVVWQGTNNMAMFWDRGVDPTGTNHWTSSAHGKTEGGNVLWNDGHVEWMRLFPGTASYSNAVHR